MSGERTLIAVVSDLVKTGLTVEQQILVNELALVVADLQRAATQRRRERERKRVYRERVSNDVPGQSQDKRKEPKENNILSNPKGGSRGELSRDTEPLFEAFWSAYPRKVAKGAAKKAYRHALTRASHEEILAGAKRYAASKPDPKFTKHPASWLNADCWLDEEPKTQASTVTRGPWKPFEPEPEVEKPPEAERRAQVERLLKRTANGLAP